MSILRGVLVVVLGSSVVACSGGDEGTGSSSGGTSKSGGDSSNKDSSNKDSSNDDSSNDDSSNDDSSNKDSSNKDSSNKKASKEYGAQCKASSECESDFCVFRSGSIGMCTQNCEDDIDCPGLGSKCVRLSDAPQKVCVPK
jgi:hypothetical protein